MMIMKMNMKKNKIREKNLKIIINPNRSLGVTVVGHKRSGKSAFVGRMAEIYMNFHDFLVMDIWSSRDQENWFWCIKDKRQYPITLIHPSYVSYKIPKAYENWIYPVLDTTPLYNILKESKKHGRVVVFDNSCYDENHSYVSLANLMKQLPQANSRLRYSICLVVREATTLLSGRVSYGKEMKLPKRQLLKLVRECRHYHVSYFLDWQRFTDVDVSARDMSDYTVIRNLEEMPGRYKNKFTRNLLKMLGVFNLPPWKGFVVVKGIPRTIINHLPGFRHKRDGRSKDTVVHLTGVETIVDEILQDEMISTSKNRFEEGWKKKTMILVKFFLDSGKTQKEVSELLNIAQPQISYYIKDM